MAGSSKPSRDAARPNRTSSADRRREQSLKLRVAVLAVLIVGGLIYKWYEQRQPSDPIAGQANVERVGESNSAPVQRREKRATTKEEVQRTPPAEPDEQATTRPQGDKRPTANKKSTEKKSPQKKTAEKSPSLVENIAIKDLDGQVIFRGQIDLQPTLDRIVAGQRLRFPNDGSTFQNREGRLPRKPAGHYQEWVHPTPKLDGPGPQRVVTGKDGEVFYTHDHYRSFKRIQ